jgi:monoamine oxidase
MLEAQQRVGGRVYTLRDPFTYGLYAEVGAMRIPRAHTLTMEYIEKFRLPVNDFTMDNLNAYYYMGGNKVRASEANVNPALLGFDVSANEKGKTAGQMYMKAIQPLIHMLERDGDEAWDEIIAEYDQFRRENDRHGSIAGRCNHPLSNPRGSFQRDGGLCDHRGPVPCLASRGSA